MASVTFDASEVHRLAADLALAPVHVSAESVEVVAKVARQTQRNAVRFAPHLTGLLESSIEVRTHGLSAEVYTDLRYAGYVEYGTSDTCPQPYMRPAADLAADPLADGLGDAGEDIL